jgi:hypothetical protein
LHFGKLLWVESGEERMAGLGDVVMGVPVVTGPAEGDAIGEDMAQLGVGLFAVDVVGFEVAKAPVTGPAPHDAHMPVPQKHRCAPLRIRPPVALSLLSYGSEP